MMYMYLSHFKCRSTVPACATGSGAVPPCSIVLGTCPSVPVTGTCRAGDMMQAGVIDMYSLPVILKPCLVAPRLGAHSVGLLYLCQCTRGPSELRVTTMRKGTVTITTLSVQVVSRSQLFSSSSLSFESFNLEKLASCV